MQIKEKKRSITFGTYFWILSDLKKFDSLINFLFNFQTTDLQDLIYQTLANDFTVTIHKFHIYDPILIPDVQTEPFFNDSITKSFTLSLDSWFNDRKFIDTDLVNQVDIGSSKNITSPKFLLIAQQSFVKKGVPNKRSCVATFNNLDAGTDSVEIDDGTISLGFC